MTATAQKNIVYKTDGIAKFFDGHRDKWEDFYLSEKWAFERIALSDGGFGRVLDAGCAVGGLGLTLSKRFQVDEYFGVDINQQAIELAQKRCDQYPMATCFECADILAMESLKNESFDNVFSLS